MSRALLDGALLPTMQPYDDPSFDGSLAEFDEMLSVAEIADETVDWVTLSLRTTPDAGSEVARRPAFLKTNGMLANLGGDPVITFAGVEAGTYHLGVCHRNHTCIMSSSAVDFSTGEGSWDFTTGMGQAYTSGGDPMKHLGDGKYGMFACDANADGQVTAPDFNLWNASTTAGEIGYLQPDCNMDGQVTAPDFNLWNANTTAGASSKVPD